MGFGSARRAGCAGGPWGSVLQGDAGGLPAGEAAV